MKSKKVLALILSVVMVAWQMPAFVFVQEEDKDSVPAETTAQEILEDKDDDKEKDEAEGPADDTEAEVEDEPEADAERSGRTG